MPTLLRAMSPIAIKATKSTAQRSQQSRLLAPELPPWLDLLPQPASQKLRSNPAQQATRLQTTKLQLTRCQAPLQARTWEQPLRQVRWGHLPLVNLRRRRRLTESHSQGLHPR
jgi:hypothetical protein